jgi:hypothetical protein
MKERNLTCSCWLRSLPMSTSCEMMDVPCRRLSSRSDLFLSSSFIVAGPWRLRSDEDKFGDTVAGLVDDEKQRNAWDFLGQISDIYTIFLDQQIAKLVNKPEKAPSQVALHES